MCEGSISCDSQQVQTCLKYFRVSADYDFTLTATSSSKSYTHCFDAFVRPLISYRYIARPALFMQRRLKKLTNAFLLENVQQDIINQCYEQGYTSGNWSLGGETYRMNIESNTLEDQFVPDVPNPAQVPLPAISPVNEPDLLVPFQESSSIPPSTPAPSATSAAANCPSVPPCPQGKACPNPVPCDQLSCSKDCCGTVPNPQWCNENCGGIHC